MIDAHTPWNSDEPIERYNSLFPTFPDFVARYTVGGDLLPEIGLADEFSLNLRKKIVAALVSQQMGIGLSYAEKNYAPNFSQSRWLGLTTKIDDVYRFGRSALDGYVKYGLDLPKTEGTLQDLSMQFFFRNVASFDAAKRLADLGYLCEVATILRSALEQFAFAAFLWPLSGLEELDKVRPLHTLNKFKKMIPISGRIYGLLSKYTHFEYDHHTHFFTRSSEAIFTVQRGPVLRAYATHLVFLTMICVGKYVVAVAPTQFNESPQSIADVSKFIAMAADYSSLVCSILERDDVLWELGNLMTIAAADS